MQPTVPEAPAPIPASPAEQPAPTPDAVTYVAGQAPDTASNASPAFNAAFSGTPGVTGEPLMNSLPDTSSLQVQPDTKDQTLPLEAEAATDASSPVATAIVDSINNPQEASVTPSSSEATTVESAAPIVSSDAATATSPVLSSELPNAAATTGLGNAAGAFSESPSTDTSTTSSVEPTQSLGQPVAVYHGATEMPTASLPAVEPTQEVPAAPPMMQQDAAAPLSSAPAAEATSLGEVSGTVVPSARADQGAVAESVSPESLSDTPTTTPPALSAEPSQSLEQPVSVAGEPAAFNQTGLQTETADELTTHIDRNKDGLDIGGYVQFYAEQTAADRKREAEAVTNAMKTESGQVVLKAMTDAMNALIEKGVLTFTKPENVSSSSSVPSTTS